MLVLVQNVQIIYLQPNVYDSHDNHDNAQNDNIKLFEEKNDSNNEEKDSEVEVEEQEMVGRLVS